MRFCRLGLCSSRSHVIDLFASGAPSALPGAMEDTIRIREIDPCVPQAHWRPLPTLQQRGEPISSRSVDRQEHLDRITRFGPVRYRLQQDQTGSGEAQSARMFESIAGHHTSFTCILTSYHIATHHGTQDGRPNVYSYSDSTCSGIASRQVQCIKDTLPDIPWIHLINETVFTPSRQDH
jgi:hypothetical protein